MNEKLADELDALEKTAGEQGWGGEFREDLFDALIQYFKIMFAKRKRVSVGGMLSYLVGCARSWFPSEDQK